MIGLGGGHEIAWASYEGIAAALQRRPAARRARHRQLRRAFRPAPAGTRRAWHVGHAVPADCRGAGRGRARVPLSLPWHQRDREHRSLFGRAASLGVEYVPDVDIGDPAVDARVEDFVARLRRHLCTFCLDVLPPAVAPGVSAPSGLGVPLHRAVALLRLLRRMPGRPGGDKLLLADVAEYAPASTPPTRARPAPRRASSTSSAPSALIRAALRKRPRQASLLARLRPPRGPERPMNLPMNPRPRRAHPAWRSGSGDVPQDVTAATTSRRPGTCMPPPPRAGRAPAAGHRLVPGRRRRGFRRGQGGQQAGVPLLGRRVVPALRADQVDDLQPARIPGALTPVRARLPRRRHAQRAETRRALRCVGYPTMILFKPDGTEITRLPGGVDIARYARSSTSRWPMRAR